MNSGENIKLLRESKGLTKCQGIIIERWQG